MSIDTIGDFLTIIRNAVLCKKTFVIAPDSKVNCAIAAILQREGFVRDVEKVASETSVGAKIKIRLKYDDGESAIHEIKRVSTPGRRVYEGVVQLRRVIGGLGIVVVTTNQGLMTDKEARQRSVGGEVLCTVW
jgi:small subunit ribosomal protein S8